MTQNVCSNEEKLMALLFLAAWTGQTYVSRWYDGPRQVSSIAKQ